MKKKIALAFLTASCYVAFPLLAQNPGNNGNHGNGNNGNHGNGNNGHHGNNSNHGGNNSNHSGHDDDGNSAGHRQDRPHGFGDNDNLVLTSPAITASVAAAVTSVTAELKLASLTTSDGMVITPSAQKGTYALLSGDAVEASPATVAAALSKAGPEANAVVPSLMESFAALRTDASRLPAAVAHYNSFTKAASTEFIAKPPAEFLAINAVLARLIAAAGEK